MARSPKKITYRYVNTEQGTSSDVLILQETVSGYENKDWRLQIAKKQDATGPYRLITASKVRTANLSAQSRRVIPGLSADFKQGRYTPLSVRNMSYTPDATARDMALTILKRRLTYDVKDFKSLIPLGELKETYSMIRSANSQTAAMLRSLIAIKRNPKLSKDIILHMASDTWLTFSFGIKPLIGDIQNLCEAIDSRLKGNANIVKEATGSWRSDVHISDGKVGSEPAAGSTFDVYRTVDGTITYKYIAGVEYTLSNLVDYSVAKQFGFTYEDLPSALWELTPYSWVADYIATFGDVIDDTFTSPAGNTIYCVEDYGYDATIRGNYVYRPLSPSSGRVGTGFSGSSSYNWFYFQRSKLGGIPHRGFRFRSFDELAYQGFNKLANLSSVLVQHSYKNPYRS